VSHLIYFWIFLKASLFSTGGMGNLPSLHADLMARRWATERQFAESLLIGQITPGPNGLWVISLGYLTGGIRGSLLALFAITLPPLLVVLVERLYRRMKDHAAVEGFMRGLSLAVVGIFVIVLAALFRSAGLNGRSAFIAGAAIALGTTRRVPIIAIISAAALAGILLDA
jgi:chromate transporter